MENILEILEQIGRFYERYGLAPTILIFIVGGALVYMIRAKEPSLPHPQGKAKTETNHLAITFFQVDAKINQILHELQREVSADWCTVWQFHNGTASIAGVPFFKVSPTHETCKCNRYLWGKEYRDLPVSLFAGDPLPVTEPGPHVLADAEDPKLNNAICNAMCHLGISCAYAFPLSLTDNGSLIGFITVAFSAHQDLTHIQLDEISQRAERISVILEDQARSSNKF